MMKPEKDPLETFQLEDKSIVSKEEVLKTAKKYMENFKYVSILAIVAGGIVLADIIIRIVKNTFDEILALVIIELIFIAVILIIWISYHEKYRIKTGLRLMNFQIIEREKLADLDYIAADFCIDREIRLYFYFNQENMTWQYSLGQQFSDEIGMDQLMNIRLLVQEKPIFDWIQQINDVEKLAEHSGGVIQIEIDLVSEDKLFFEASPGSELLKWLDQMIEVFKNDKSNRNG